MYHGACIPLRVHTVVVSVQHSEKISLEELRADVMTKVIRVVIPEKYLDDGTTFHINPCGLFVVGGPQVSGWSFGFLCLYVVCVFTVSVSPSQFVLHSLGWFAFLLRFCCKLKSSVRSHHRHSLDHMTYSSAVFYSCFKFGCLFVSNSWGSKISVYYSWKFLKLIKLSISIISIYCAYEFV